MTILIDVANLGYACLHAKERLRSGSVETTAVFGVLGKLRNIRRENAGRMVVLWDGRSWRYETYPEYKGNRKVDPAQIDRSERWKQQARLVRAILPSLGIDQISVDNYEADDIAALMVKRSTAPITLVSGDTDWLQLVRDGRVCWVDPIRQVRITSESYTEKTGFKFPFCTAEFKALTGDTSDNIKGCGGVGEKTAKEILSFGTVANFLARFDLEKLECSGRALKFAKDEQARETYEANMKLIWLEHPAIPAPVNVKRVPGNLDADRFAHHCESLAFISIIKQLDSWVTTFASE